MLFIGNLIVIAVCKLLADGMPNPPVVVYAQRLVIVTGLAFTATGAMLIVVSGQVLTEGRGGGFSGPPG